MLEKPGFFLEYEDDLLEANTCWTFKFIDQTCYMLRNVPAGYKKYAWRIYSDIHTVAML